MKDDYTFGVRLLSFLEMMYDEMGGNHQMVIEEYEYLCCRACDEIEEKFNDEQNRWYFDNLVKGCKDYKEFIEKRFDKTFVDKLLKNIRRF